MASKRKAINPYAALESAFEDYHKYLKAGKVKRQRKKRIKTKLRGKYKGSAVSQRIELPLREGLNVDEIVYQAERALRSRFRTGDVYATITLYERQRKIGSGEGKKVGRGGRALVQTFIGVHSVPVDAMSFQIRQLMERYTMEARYGTIVHSVKFYRREG